MNVQAETLKDGTVVYRFRYRKWVEISEVEYHQKNKKRVKKEGDKYFKEVNKTVPQNKLPPLESLEQAKEYLPILESKYDSRKNKRLMREKWHEQYYSFDSLVETYLTDRVKKAKNSIDAKKNWFVNYVLYYFLHEKRCANLEEWKFHFYDFKDWLENSASQKRSGKPLSLASQNHCITELNAFLRIMSLRNKCEVQPRLDLHPDRVVNNMKTAEDLVSKEESERIYEYFIDNDIAWKPLKSKPSMDYKYARCVPIVDKKACAEGPYLYKKALKLGIDKEGGEPTDIQIRDASLKEGMTKNELIFFFTYRGVASWRQGDPDRAYNPEDPVAEIKKYIRSSKNRLNVKDTVFSYDTFLQIYKDKMGKDFNYKNSRHYDIAPYRGGHYIQGLSLIVDRSREKNILKVLERKINQFDKVFIVYGSGHYLKHRPVLKDIFKNYEVFQIKE